MLGYCSPLTTPRCWSPAKRTSSQRSFQAWKLSSISGYLVQRECTQGQREQTQLIVFGNRQNLRNLSTANFEITFRDANLVPCDEVKNLGVTFDKNLTWNSHVGAVSRRCTGTLIGLSHVRHLVPRGVIITLVSALVLSQVRYCISVYGNGSKQNLARVQKILNFAAKVIFGRRKYDHATDLREKLGWLDARQLVEFSTLCLTHKVIENGEPDSLAAALHLNADVRERNTRQSGLLNVPRSRQRFYV